MTTDFKELLDSLERTRADFEARLADVPAWKALSALDAFGTLPADEVQRQRHELSEALKANHVYQGWLEIAAAMAKLAVGAARAAPTVEPVPPAPAAKATAPLAPDDLLRIRGITPAQSVALHRMGVRRFADIAAWTSADVARMSAALGLGDAISRQNWIEQAAVKAPEAVRAATAAVAGAKVAAKPQANVETKPQAAAPSPASLAPAPQAEAAPADDLTRIRGIRPATAAALNKLGVTSFATIANWTAGDVQRVSSALGLGDDISRMSWIEQAAMRVPAGALRVASPVSRAAVAGKPAAQEPEAKAHASAPEPAKPVVLSEKAVETIDDLTEIRGISGDLAKRLNVIGVTRLEQIANWSSADVARVSGVLDVGEQIARQGWIEQAAMRHLRRGGTLKPAAPAAAAAKPAPVPGPAAREKPASLAPQPVVAAPPPGIVAAQEAPAVVAQPAVQTFSSALAAIRAELTAPLPVAAVLAPLPPLPDPLEQIDGIDAPMMRRLADHGVDRFATIAGWTAADVARMTEALQIGDQIGAKGWIEQAAILARGGTTAYARRSAAVLPMTVPMPPPSLAPMPLPVMPPPLPAKPVAPATEAKPQVAAAPPPATTVPPSLPSALARPAQPAPVASVAAPAPDMPVSPTVQTAIAASLAARTAEAAAPPAPAALEPAHPVPPPVPQWPSMVPHRPVVATAPATVPSPPRSVTPSPFDVNALPGPAEFVPATASAPQTVAHEPAPGPRAMEGGLAAALAAAAATASAGPRLRAGHLSEQIRELPAAVTDPYLEDLSDWVQDAAEDLPAEFAIHGPEAGYGDDAAFGRAAEGEAEVAIVRASAPPDLGSVNPAADLPFDGERYAAYRREVQEASVEIVADPGSVRPGDVMPSGRQIPGAEPPGGLRRLLRAFRGNSQGS